MSLHWRAKLTSESRYLDWLIGPYPQAKERYRERSPLYHADQLSKPVIFFQGVEDAIVPPNQAEALVEALRRKRKPVGYLLFSGEQHGFRKAATIPALPGRGTPVLRDRGLQDRPDVLKIAKRVQCRTGIWRRSKVRGLLHLAFP